jgi:hypothetical protein
MCTPATTWTAHGSLKRMRGDGVMPFYHRLERREHQSTRRSSPRMFVENYFVHVVRSRCGSVLPRVRGDFALLEAHVIRSC